MVGERIGVVLSTHVGNEREQLGGHRQQHVELVLGLSQVDKHMLPQQRFTRLQETSS